MSVTIVSAPNVSAAPVTPDAAAGDAASGDDFANVLLGQIALGAAPVPGPTNPTAALPGATASSDGDGDTADASTEAAFDATSLLATMAFVAPPVNADTTTAATLATNGDDAARGVPLAMLADTPAGGRGVPGTGLPATATDSAATAPVSGELPAPVPGESPAPVSGESPATSLPGATLPASATTGEAPAKFAVATATIADATPRQAVAESSSGDPALPTENMHAAGHAVTGRHPAHSESTLAVSTPVRDADWSGDFGQKIVWLATSETQSAQLTLNPAQMGPIEISLSVERGNASVSFASANAEVREAIETALPRLREMLASAGIELGQTNVGAESFRQQQQSARDGSSTARSTGDGAILAADSPLALPSRAFATQRGNGLVDLFA